MQVLQAIAVEAKLAELLGAQAELATQLATVPQNVPTGALTTETPNRLYEQLKLEQINTLGHISRLEIRCPRLEKQNDTEGHRKCTSELTDLKAVNTVLEEQLETVPATIKKAAEKKPNKLYEQLMLENIRLLSQISGYEVRCSEEKSKTANSELVDDLRSEIAILKTLVADLSVENKKLSALVEKLTAQNANFIHTAAPSPCEERTGAMQKKLDDLNSLGYGGTHPDVINVTKQLSAVEAKCAAEPAAMNASNSCIARLTDLEKKFDMLKSLGYLQSHPDVRNVSHQITSIKNECLAKHHWPLTTCAVTR